MTEVDKTFAAGLNALMPIISLDTPPARELPHGEEGDNLIDFIVSPTPPVEDEVVNKCLRVDLETSLRGLSKFERAVIAGRFDRELTHQEIAKFTGKSRRAVQCAEVRALNKLRMVDSLREYL